MKKPGRKRKTALHMLMVFLGTSFGVFTAAAARILLFPMGDELLPEQILRQALMSSVCVTGLYACTRCYIHRADA